MWNLFKKVIQMNFFTKQKPTHRQKTNLCLPQGRRELGRDKLGVWD